MSKKPEHETAGTAVVHVHDGGSNHVVGVRALHVLLTQDSGCWFAQGLEIDYAAAGMNEDEVKENFGTGLAKTIREHLVMHGSVSHLLQVAPQDAWNEYYTAPPESMKAFHMVTAEFIKKALSKPEATEVASLMPFDMISFVRGKTAQAEAACA